MSWQAIMPQYYLLYWYQIDSQVSPISLFAKNTLTLAIMYLFIKNQQHQKQ